VVNHYSRESTRKKESETSEKKAPVIDLKPEIDYEEFTKVDLRVGKILAAEAVPKSNKLLKLKIDIGEERTIVAGIGKDYTSAELIGKKIVIVANFKAGEINGRGVLRYASGYRYE